MEGACLHATRDIRYEKDLPKPKPGKGEVLIAIKVCGTCGSDVHLYLGDYGDMMKYPFIVGHEASGVVEELGGGVTGLKIGDRVCIEPVQPQATQMLAQYYVHRADKVHKLPDHVSLDEGAMIEPLAVAVHAVKRSGMKAGDNVLVLGAGPIGQFCLVAAKAYGAARIIVTDVKGPRLDTVSLFGADGTVNVAGLSPEESAEAVKKEFPGGKIDVVLDAVGNEASLNTACAAVGTLGTVLLVGVAQLAPKIPYFHVLARELTVVGSIYYGPHYPEALELVASGKVDIKKMASHHLKMEQVKDAFEWCVKGEDDSGRAVTKALFKIAD